MARTKVKGETRRESFKDTLCCMKRNEFHPCISRAYMRYTLYLSRINLNGYSERLSYINCGVGGSPFISFIVISDRQYRRPAGTVKKQQQQQPPLPPFTRSLTNIFYSLPSRIFARWSDKMFYFRQRCIDPRGITCGGRWELTLSFVYLPSSLLCFFTQRFLCNFFF